MNEKHESCPHCKSIRRIYLENKIYCRKCYSKLPKGIDSMFNKCENLRIRTKKGKKYLYCKLYKKKGHHGGAFKKKGKRVMRYGKDYRRQSRCTKRKGRCGCADAPIKGAGDHPRACGCDRRRRQRLKSICEQ